jgi:hypothetical protein
MSRTVQDLFGDEWADYLVAYGWSGCMHDSDCACSDMLIQGDSLVLDIAMRNGKENIPHEVEQKVAEIQRARGRRAAIAKGTVWLVWDGEYEAILDSIWLEEADANARKAELDEQWRHVPRPEMLRDIPHVVTVEEREVK